jgi:hypothetical protein
MNTQKNPSMLPVSGRIPVDLYQWLSVTPLDGATTMSDKLRVAISALKRLHEGDTDYEGALAMQRDLQGNTRRQLMKLEAQLGHSEVLATLLEHSPAVNATLTSAQLATLSDAQRTEEQAIRRCLQMTESLLRQALTKKARAYNPQVVLDNVDGILELALLIQKTTNSETKESSNVR